MYRRLWRAAEEPNSEAGMGMLLVIALTAVITILVAVLGNIAVNSLGATVRHNNFDAALASAESGIDQTLSRLQQAYVDNNGADYPDPGPASADCPTTSIQPHAGAFASPSDERTWARTQISQLLAAHPACLQHSANGDFIVVKPALPATGDVGNGQTIYSEGWSPAYGVNGAKVRLVKAEYLFQPYAPSNAILTGCNLTIEHSTTVQGAPGVDPSLASVHSNCDVTVASCAVQVTGQVSATGGTSGCSNKLGGDHKIDQTPEQSVPDVTARQVYSQNATKYPNTWYDMCPDGTVRSPSASGPCTGTQVTPRLSIGGQYNGFVYQGQNANGSANWTSVNSGVSSGTYYFQGGNVSTGDGNPTTASLTIIAAALNDTDFTSGVCPKVGGTVNWNKNDITAPAIPNLFMFADGDLSTGPNFTAGGAVGTTITSGYFVAGDQINLTTSSNGAYGAVIAEDQCAASPGEQDIVDNPAIYYDPNAQAPFTSVIDTTLWLEYTGS